MEKLKVNPRNLRIVNGLTQTRFWDRFGITQSGGSRYESGERQLPPSLALILWITYVEHVDLNDVNRDIIDIGKLLKKNHPEMYASLLKEVTFGRKN